MIERLANNCQGFTSEPVVAQFEVRQALPCRSFGDKLKFVGHFPNCISTRRAGKTPHRISLTMKANAG
jgi:hypothetical protein